MTAILGHPALRLLARRKLRGVLRKQARRLRSWKGILLTVLGISLFLLWMGSLVLHAFVGEKVPLDPAQLKSFVRIGALVLTLVSLSGALVHRGLYMPREETERLFSSPIHPSDVVRYRLLVNVGRGVLGGLLLALLTANRMPRYAYAFVGVFLLAQTVPVLHQAAAILSGLIEGRLMRRFRWVRTLLMGLFLAGVFVGAPLLFLFRKEERVPDIPVLGPALRGLFRLGTDGLLEHPILVGAATPFEPWVRMIVARDASEFFPWFFLAIGLWVLAAEATARLPIDYRELSLETSANVAARLRRARRGGGAATARVTESTRGFHVVWFFGRGPAGAVAWRKLVSIIRKAKGTLTVSGLVLILVTVLSLPFASDDASYAWAGPALVAGLGTLYLCAGLRFDFRDELERMQVIKAWPVPPMKLFAAMILPEACVVSLLLVFAVIVRALLEGQPDPAVVGIVAVLPLVVLGWIALDNAAFLYLPVRFVPGQEGALQNAGRGVLMMFVRGVALVVMGATCVLPSIGVYLLGEQLGWGSQELLFAFAMVLVVALVAFDFLALWIGGRMLVRFDVARDRG